MSNLGWYQWMTSTSKKVGGPLRFMGILIGGGIVVGSAVGSTGTELIHRAKRKKKTIKEMLV